MHIATVRITMQPEKKTDTVLVLTTLCTQAGVMPGCLFCRFYDQTGLGCKEDELLLIQKWESKEAMEKHILSPAFQHLMEIMDFAETPPEMMFYNVSDISGIEMIEDLFRNQSGSDFTNCFT